MFGIKEFTAIINPPQCAIMAVGSGSVEIDPDTGKASMSMCLKHKREATRVPAPNVTYKCIKSKAELEKNIDGSLSIKSLVLE